MFSRTLHPLAKRQATSDKHSRSRLLKYPRARRLVLGAWYLVLGTSILSLLISPIPTSAETPGLSPYVRRVIERVREADIPAGGAGTGWDGDDRWRWLQYGMSAVFGTRDSAAFRTAESKRLSQMTACHYADITLIEHEMESVRLRLWEAEDAENDMAIQRLSSLYEFLSERLKVLENGGTQPGLEDEKWSSPWAFDPPDTLEALKEEELCPFSTKYLDMNVDGSVGCTPDVLEEALAMLLASSFSPNGGTMRATQAEYDALAALVTQLNAARLPGEETPEPEGEQREGCVSSWPRGARGWSAGRFFQVPGGRFIALLRLLANVELLRSTPFAPENPLVWGNGINIFSPELARDRRAFMTAQASADALLRIGIVEFQGIEEAFAPLTQSIGELGRLTKEINPGAGDTRSNARSLRDFARDAAFFLRRSCMNRDCNASLERAYKILATDECFPYTSGEGDMPDDATQEERDAKAQQLQEKCAAAAGVNVEGL